MLLAQLGGKYTCRTRCAPGCIYWHFFGVFIGNFKSENYETCKCRSILTKRVKVQHEKKAVSNSKGMQNVVFEQTTTKVIGLFIP